MRRDILSIWLLAGLSFVSACAGPFASSRTPASEDPAVDACIAASAGASTEDLHSAAASAYQAGQPERAVRLLVARAARADEVGALCGRPIGTEACASWVLVASLAFAHSMPDELALAGSHLAVCGHGDTGWSPEAHLVPAVCAAIAKAAIPCPYRLADAFADLEAAIDDAAARHQGAQASTR